jgi:hypothetical protein
MDTELQQSWTALIADVGDLESLISATRAFLELASDDALQEDAPYIAELVLGGRPPTGVVDVLEAAWSAHGAARATRRGAAPAARAPTARWRISRGAEAAAGARGARRAAPAAASAASRGLARAPEAPGAPPTAGAHVS